MPRMEADFDWGDVQASTPVHDKGDYELTIARVRGRAWFKKDKSGNPTSEITKVVALTPKIVGQYDSNGKLNTEKKDQDAEEINLWVHSDGGRKMAKKSMMAICGYNPDDKKEEDEFNKFLKTSGLQLGTPVEDGEEDGKLVLNLGEGWEKLLVGKNVRAHLDKETREQEGKEPIVQQNYVRLSPVNSTNQSKKK